MTNLYSFEWEQTLCVYFEENGKTWWPLALILKHWGLSFRPTTFFKKYSISSDQQKRLSEFSNSFLSLPKTSFFISEQAFLTLVKSLKVELPEKQSSISSLESFVSNPKRDQLATKVTSKVSLAKAKKDEPSSSEVKVVVFSPDAKASKKNQIKDRQKLKDIVSLSLKIAEAVNVFLVIQNTQLDYKTKEQCLQWSNQLQKELKSCKFTEIEIP